MSKKKNQIFFRNNLQHFVQTQSFVGKRTVEDLRQKAEKGYIS